MLLAFLGACFLNQSDATGMAVICDAPRTCDDCRLAAPEAQVSLLTEHIEARLYNRQARETLDALATTHRTKRGAVLRAAAAGVGLQECAFAELMDTLAEADEDN